MIKVINLSKSYSQQLLLDEVSFIVNPRERIGLVGRNGHGKTTLFKMILGHEHPDSGEIVIPKNYTIGNVNQHISFSKPTVIAEACMGLPAHEADEKWKAEKILSGLGFSKDDMERNPSEFSGGYQVRLNLAKALVAEPEMILLDEPTNYLDVVSIRWLSRFLREWKSELMLITHDRGFMDGIITHTAGIHRKKIRKIAGTTDKLYDQIIKEEEIYEKTRINDEKKRKETEEYITRFRAKARLAGLVQSRIKALERQDRLDKLEKIKSLEFTFNYSGFNAKTVMTASDIAFSYSEKNPLIKNMSITIGSRDRICVIGKNGKGKTTLLRILEGGLKQTSGEINYHPNAKIGYYAQTNTTTLNPKLTIEEEIMLTGCERQKARDIAGSMLFDGDNALKKISVLSGGEKSRVLLGKIIVSPANIIFLDEPTNHLDMESCDALMAAIDDFDGAVVMVTHNEMFLHSLATRFIVFREGGISVFEGSYQHFLEKIGWEDESDLKGKDQEKPENQINKKDLRKLRADIITRRSKELKPLETRLEQIEKNISHEETQLNIYNDEMINASSTGDGKKIQELSKKFHSTKEKIDSLYTEFGEASDRFDLLTKQFESEMKLLDEQGE